MSAGSYSADLKLQALFTPATAAAVAGSTGSGGPSQLASGSAATTTLAINLPVISQVDGAFDEEQQQQHLGAWALPAMPQVDGAADAAPTGAKRKARPTRCGDKGGSASGAGPSKPVPTAAAGLASLRAKRSRSSPAAASRGGAAAAAAASKSKSPKPATRRSGRARAAPVALSPSPIKRPSGGARGGRGMGSSLQAAAAAKGGSRASRGVGGAGDAGAPSPSQRPLGTYEQLLVRAKTQLGRMRQDLALIEAYESEGWKGAARERVKPTAELSRARKHVAKGKAVIRECVRMCEEAGGARAIPREQYDSDGELDAEHIFCGVCGSFESTDVRGGRRCSGVSALGGSA